MVRRQAAAWELVSMATSFCDLLYKPQTPVPNLSSRAAKKKKHNLSALRIPFNPWALRLSRSIPQAECSRVVQKHLRNVSILTYAAPRPLPQGPELCLGEALERLSLSHITFLFSYDKMQKGQAVTPALGPASRLLKSEHSSALYRLPRPLPPCLLIMFNKH